MRYRFLPADGTIGGGRDGGTAFMSGMGAASASYTVKPGGDVDPRFAAGQPGIYVVTMVVEGVPLAGSKVPLHEPGPYNAALRAQGLNATVTKVAYQGNRNLRDANWADSLLTDVFGGGSGTKNAIVDMVFAVTVRIDPPPAPVKASTPGSPSASVPRGGAAWAADDPFSPAGVAGMGAVVVSAGAVFAVVAVIAVVLAATFPGFGKMVLDSVKFVGAAAGAAVGGAAGAVADNAVPILVAVGVGALAIYLLRKGGAKYRSRGGSFSF